MAKLRCKCGNCGAEWVDSFPDNASSVMMRDVYCRYCKTAKARAVEEIIDKNSAFRNAALGGFIGATIGSSIGTESTNNYTRTETVYSESPKKSKSLIWSFILLLSSIGSVSTYGILTSIPLFLAFIISLPIFCFNKWVKVIIIFGLLFGAMKIAGQI